MKKKNKSKKLIKKLQVIFCTFCAFSISFGSVVPMSYSKYVDEKENILRFTTAFYQKAEINAGDFEFLDSYLENDSDYQTAYFSFSFERSSHYKTNEINDENKDTYFINIPNNCTIKGLSSSPKDTGIASNVNINIGNKTVTFKDSVDYKTTVVFSCPVSKVIKGQDVIVKVSVDEKVGNESKFNYASGDKVVTNYYKEHPFPDFSTTEEPTKDYTIEGNTLTIEFNSDKLNSSPDYYYTLVQDFIKNYNSTYSDILDAYFTEYYDNITNSIFEVTDFSKEYPALPGLTISKYVLDYKVPNTNQVTTKTFYQYILNEGILGYARTYLVSPSLSSSRDHIIYFSSEDEEILNQQLNYYLKNYFYPSNSEKYELVSSYVASMGGIDADFINREPDKVIYGIVYKNSTEDKVRVINTIEDLAINKLNAENLENINKKEVPFILSYHVDYIKYVYKNSFNFISDDLISQSVKQLLINDPDNIHNINELAISRNRNDAFNEYFLTYDAANKHYVMARAYSKSDMSQNEVTFNIFDYQDKIELKFYADGTFDVVIDYGTLNTLEDAKRIQSALKSYFEKTMDVTVDLPTITKNGVIEPLKANAVVPSLDSTTDDVIDSVTIEETNETIIEEVIEENTSVNNTEKDSTLEETEEKEKQEEITENEEKEETKDELLANLIDKPLEEKEAKDTKEEKEEVEEKETKEETKVTVDVNKLDTVPKEVDLLKIDKVVKPKDKEEVEDEILPEE